MIRGGIRSRSCIRDSQVAWELISSRQLFTGPQRESYFTAAAAWAVGSAAPIPRGPFVVHRFAEQRFAQPAAAKKCGLSRRADLEACLHQEIWLPLQREILMPRMDLTDPGRRMRVR